MKFTAILDLCLAESIAALTEAIQPVQPMTWRQLQQSWSLNRKVEKLLTETEEKNADLTNEKREVEHERSVYENERETLISSLEKEENANHHTMQKYALEIEHRSELQRQMVKLRNDLCEA